MDNEREKICGIHGGISHDSCISLVPIFNHLTHEQMEEISAYTKGAHYRKGEMVFRAGEPSDALYIISRGKLKITRISESGKEQIQRVLTPGDFTGELALFSDDVHESFGEALEDTDICMVRREDLQGLLVKYPAISMKILGEFSRRLGASEKRATLIANEKVETRLAMYIAETFDRYGEGDEVTLPMLRKDLASHLGTTPETVSRKLLEIEETGLIAQLPGNRLKILDLDGLLLI